MRYRMLISAAITAASLAGFQAHAEALEKSLVVVATGGSFEAALDKYFYQPFEKDTGVKITPVAASNPEQFAKLKAMEQAGAVEYDIVTGDPTSNAQYRDLLQTLDCGRLKNLSSALTDSCREKGLLRTYGGGVIAYNTDAFPKGGPQSFKDFWDVARFPGPRALPNAGDPQWVLAAALLADGVAPENLFPMDLDRAFKKLDEIKPNVTVWWRSGDQSQQILRSGEVVMSFMWSGRAIGLKKEKFPIAITWNQAMRDYATWGIAKSAPHPEAAYAFLDFYLGHTDGHAAFISATNNATSSRKVADLLTEEQRQTLGLIYWDSMVDVNANEWVQHNIDNINERWNAWLTQ